MSSDPASVTETTEAYYDSSEADAFYAAIWGGNDIHIGIYERDDDSVHAASSRTVAAMASRVRGVIDGLRVLDLGSGYGGSARTLAGLFGCRVDCLNLSQVQNERNRELCLDTGLDGKIEVIHGSFEAMPRGRRVPRPRRICITFGAPLTPDRLESRGKGERAEHRIADALRSEVLRLAETASR